MNNLFVTFGQSSATKILTQGDGRKWGGRKGHKSSLRHTSSRVWFAQTIDTTTTAGHSHICLYCGSQFAEPKKKKSSGLITALSKRRGGLVLAEKASVFAFILRRAGLGLFPVRNVKLPQLCLSDLIYLAAAAWDESFYPIMGDLWWISAYLLYGTRDGNAEASDLWVFFLLLSSWRSPMWLWSHPQVMWSRPPLRWLSMSVALSLWNLSCAAAEDSFHSLVQPKYQAMCPNGKCRHTLKKTPAVTRFLCASIYLLHKYGFRIPQ